MNEFTQSMNQWVNQWKPSHLWRHSHSRTSLDDMTVGITLDIRNSEVWNMKFTLIKVAEVFFSFLTLHLQTSVTVDMDLPWLAQGIKILKVWARRSSWFLSKVSTFPTQNTPGVFLSVSLRSGSELVWRGIGASHPGRLWSAWRWYNCGWGRGLVGGWNQLELGIPKKFHSQKTTYSTAFISGYFMYFYIIPVCFGMIWEFSRVLDFFSPCVIHVSNVVFVEWSQCFGFFWNFLESFVLVFGANAVVNTGWGWMGKDGYVMKSLALVFWMWSFWMLWDF